MRKRLLHVAAAVAAVSSILVGTPAHAAGNLQYRVVIDTGNVQNAGTDANVYVQIFGDQGMSAPILLDNPNRNDFERGQTDDFAFTAPDVGNFQRIKIWHDNTGERPGWFLNSIVLNSPYYQFLFNVNRWLAKDEMDGATCLEEPPYSTQPVACETPQRIPTEHTQNVSAWLARQQVWQGIIPYYQNFGQFIPDGQLNEISNPNTYTVGLIRRGNVPSDQSGAVWLPPGAKTTPNQIAQLYGGSTKPMLPVPIQAVILNGSTIPDNVSLVVNYTYWE